MLLASSLAFFLVIFLVASILTAIAYLAFLKMKADESDAERSDLTLSRSLSRRGAGRRHREELGFGIEPSVLLQDGRLSSITFWDTVLAHFDFGAILKNRLEQADLRWSVGRITSMMLLIGIVTLAVLMRLLPLWAAFLGAAAASMAPYGYVLHLRNKRFMKFRENFPDALDSLARALRAGYPLSAGMEMITAETAPPVSGELRRTSAEANLGRGWPHALENLGKRVPLLEINLFIAAVQLHARTGGKLSEVMTGLAENMRESNALQGEVRALAAYGKLTGLILTILPIGIAIMMLIVSPGYMQVLFNQPRRKTVNRRRHRLPGHRAFRDSPYCKYSGMTFGLLAAMFLFVLAAVSVAGYVFVLRPSKAEAGEVQIPQAISINQRDLPAAQAAFADTFQVLGESLPLPGDHEALRRQLVIAGYRWPASVAIFLGIKAASAVLFGVAVLWLALVTGTGRLRVDSRSRLRPGIRLHDSGSRARPPR